jgi:hypothetical protein
VSNKSIGRLRIFKYRVNSECHRFIIIKNQNLEQRTQSYGTKKPAERRLVSVHNHYYQLHIKWSEMVNFGFGAACFPLFLVRWRIYKSVHSDRWEAFRRLFPPSHFTRQERAPKSELIISVLDLDNLRNALYGCILIILVFYIMHYWKIFAI